MAKKEKPYIYKTIKVTKKLYNPNYGDNRVCECGHPYERHFDWWGEPIGEPAPVGCKYCECYTFKERSDKK